jgi:asparagine synthase (glutamine-hydrolysing)
MCGICGIYSFNGPLSNPLSLKKMADIIRHRGPDDEGFFYNSRALQARVIENFRVSPQKVKMIQGTGNIGLGHRRLSIIDLSGGHQPLSNENQSVWITFNGEIYNFQELKNTLLGLGHNFNTKSDTEVIVHAYESWGDLCVKKLRGMFAFAIWDEKEKRLFLARDPLGIKPLYYYFDSQVFIFASEIKAILQYPCVKREIDLEALHDYLKLLYVPAPKSIFKGIRKLLPGHTLTIDDRGIQDKEYWDIEFVEAQDRNEESIQSDIIELLRESIGLQMISEVPLGAFLSGGIDSSAVVALMTNINRQGAVKTASIGFSEKKFNELDYARLLAQKYNTDHYEMIVKADAVSVLDKLSWYYDEPFADSSAIPTYYVSQIAREKVTVVLSGDGGDENFAGYARRYYYDRLENQLRRLFPAPFRKYGIGTLAALYPKADWLPQFLRAKTLLTNLSLSPAEGFFNTMSYCKQGLMDQLLKPSVKEALKGYDSTALFRKYYDKADTKDPLSKIQYIDIKMYLVDDILTKVDRASMAHSLEVRVPLLDHIFMEKVATIPSKLKLRHKTGKYIFKKALEPYLPPEILYRGKMGFSIPLSQWLRNELKSQFEETVLTSDALCHNFFDKGAIQRIWTLHQKRACEYATELWTLLFFEKWARNYLNNC